MPGVGRCNPENARHRLGHKPLVGQDVSGAEVPQGLRPGPFQLGRGSVAEASLRARGGVPRPHMRRRLLRASRHLARPACAVRESRNDDRLNGVLVPGPGARACFSVPGPLPLPPAGPLAHPPALSAAAAALCIFGGGAGATWKPHLPSLPSGMCLAQWVLFNSEHSPLALSSLQPRRAALPCLVSGIGATDPASHQATPVSCPSGQLQGACCGRSISHSTTAWAQGRSECSMGSELGPGHAGSCLPPHGDHGCVYFPG